MILALSFKELGLFFATNYSFCIIWLHNQSYAKKYLYFPLFIHPEAYILHDALKAWLEGEDKAKILDAGLKAIVKYQKYSYKAASTILCTGF